MEKEISMHNDNFNIDEGNLHDDKVLLNLYSALSKEQRIEFIKEIIKGINEVQTELLPLSLIIETNP